MKYTNNLNLPQPLVDAVINDDYTKGDARYSITGLMTPPQIAQLMREHPDRIVEDVADKLPALFGKLVHKLLEDREREGFAEPVIFFELDGVKVKAGLDRLVISKQHLDDYKFVSLHKFYKTGQRGVPIDYEKQMQGYHYALSTVDYSLRSCDIVAMYRDYKRGVMLRSDVGEYPQSGAERWKVDLWSLQDARAFLIERLKLHEEARVGNPAECSAEDRWADPPSFAVMKKGAKRAVRVYQSRESAEEHVQCAPEADREKYSIQYRAGINKRCEGWCAVSDFCAQFARIKAEQKRAAEAGRDQQDAQT